jgi:hypothetical protein
VEVFFDLSTLFLLLFLILSSYTPLISVLGTGSFCLANLTSFDCNYHESRCICVVISRAIMHSDDFNEQSVVITLE